jgi:hypothetical protein
LDLGSVQLDSHGSPPGVLRKSALGNRYEFEIPGFPGLSKGSTQDTRVAVLVRFAQS